MLKHYLIRASKRPFRDKGYVWLNIGGLALGLVVCFLIVLYVQDEQQYDLFYPNNERIYRVALERHYPDKVRYFASSPMPLANALRSGFPEVEASVRITEASSNIFAKDIFIRHKERSFYEERFFFADSNYFGVFRLSILEGSAATALQRPHTVILTESTARRYFGDESALGKTIITDSWGEFTVTGVCADLPPQAHFRFDFLASDASFAGQRDENWGTFRGYTYVLLRPETAPDVFQAKLPLVIQTQARSFIERWYDSYETFQATGNDWVLFLQPLTDIHLYSQLERELEVNGNIQTVYLLIAIAVVILLLAGINFINLATARADQRAKEVGVRKALGAHQRQLIGQFMLESVWQTGLAFVLAGGLTIVLLPAFNVLANKDLDWAHLQTMRFWLGAGSLAAILTLGAGSYPAFLLARFRPVQALKGGQTSRPKPHLLNGLVVMQFAMSMILLVGAVVAYKQLDYMQHKPLGFDKEQLLLIEGSDVLDGQQDAFKQTLQAQPGVKRVSLSNTLPSKFVGGMAINVRGQDTNVKHPTSFLFVDPNFVETWGMQVVEGRSFLENLASDSSAMVINETAARQLGIHGAPIGAQVQAWLPEPFTVVGMVKDFHFKALSEAITPLAFVTTDVLGRRYTSVRIAPTHVAKTLIALETTWKQFAPDRPFRYSFVDQDFEKLYHAEEQTGRFFLIAAAFALGIACLGIFGLAAAMAERRTKEIGIRKVIGASVASLLVLLTRQYLILTAIAFSLAVPVAYFAMHLWLQNFAYRISIGAEVFFLVGGLTVVVALLTVSYQALRTALTNPVNVLREQ